MVFLRQQSNSSTPPHSVPFTCNCTCHIKCHRDSYFSWVCCPPGMQVFLRYKWVQLFTSNLSALSITCWIPFLVLVLTKNHKICYFFCCMFSCWASGKTVTMLEKGLYHKHVRNVSSVMWQNIYSTVKFYETIIKVPRFNETLHVVH